MQKLEQKNNKDSMIPSNTLAAVELACVVNQCNTIAVVGHSDCKTINMLYSMRNNMSDKSDKSALKSWLKQNGSDTVEKYFVFEKDGFKKPLSFSELNSNKFDAYIDPENKFAIQEKFSQINTLEQLKNVQNYEFLKERMKKKDLKSYALWLDGKYKIIYVLKVTRNKKSPFFGKIEFSRCIF